MKYWFVLFAFSLVACESRVDKVFEKANAELTSGKLRVNTGGISWDDKYSVSIEEDLPLEVDIITAKTNIIFFEQVRGGVTPTEVSVNFWVDGEKYDISMGGESNFIVCKYHIGKEDIAIIQKAKEIKAFVNKNQDKCMNGENGTWYYISKRGMSFLTVDPKQNPWRDYAQKVDSEQYSSDDIAFQTTFRKKMMEKYSPNVSK